MTDETLFNVITYNDEQPTNTETVTVGDGMAALAIAYTWEGGDELNRAEIKVNGVTVNRPIWWPILGDKCNDFQRMALPICWRRGFVACPERVGIFCNTEFMENMDQVMAWDRRQRLREQGLVEA